MVLNGQVPVEALFPLPAQGSTVYTPSAGYSFVHSDWVGSGRLVSSASTGSVLSDSAYAPFGEQYAQTGNNFYSFTGIQQWTVSGSDGFRFRRCSPVQSKWISPDPGGQAAVDMTNPQTWNGYAYVANRPMTSLDKVGLACRLLEYEKFG